MRVRARHLLPIALLVGFVVALTACSSDDSSADGSSSTSADAASTEPVTLRLGYFPNVTHAPAIVGVDDGTFEAALGDNVTLEPKTFNAGPDVVTAIFSGALDASFIGPNPAINAYAQSQGEAIRIVSGTTSGGAFLVVKPSIDSPEDLEGTTIATPQLGNTQDVAARAWLKDEGYTTDTAGGGEVRIQPQENAITLDSFKQGLIDGAWVPEPWATRLVDEAGGTILVDEADLWPNGEYVTTHLIVATEFLEEHPDVVKQLLAGLVQVEEDIAADPGAAQETVSEGIERITGKPIGVDLVAASFESLQFTTDPIASSLRKSAEDAEELGLLEPVDLDGIYDLTLLNEVRASKDLEEVSAS